MLCTGYNQTSRQFEFLNSWGSKWGKNGYGYFPYSYMTSPYIINRTKVVLIFDAWTIIMQ
jgi:C1A family cysteine protease